MCSYSTLTAGSLNLSTTFDLFLTDMLPSSLTYMYLQQVTSEAVNVSKFSQQNPSSSYDT